MAANVLFIAKANGEFEVISDEPATVYLRNDRLTDPHIPIKVASIVSVHEFSREIGGVEVARFSPEEVAEWHLTDETPKETMAHSALLQAEAAGLVNNINRDHAMVFVQWGKEDSQWHCYLEFEEDV